MTQEPDTRPGPYYVSVRRDDGDFRLLSGPYLLHASALAAVAEARTIATDLDSRAVWYSFGTVRMKPEFSEPGILNRLGKMEP